MRLSSASQWSSKIVDPGAKETAASARSGPSALSDLLCRPLSQKIDSIVCWPFVRKLFLSRTLRRTMESPFSSLPVESQKKNVYSILDSTRTLRLRCPHYFAQPAMRSSAMINGVLDFSHSEFHPETLNTYEQSQNPYPAHSSNSELGRSRSSSPYPKLPRPLERRRDERI